MEERHSNALKDYLERAYYNGYAVEPKWKLLRWYSQERFTVGIRQDIRERWDESFDSNTELLFAELGTMRPRVNTNSIMIIKDDLFYEDDE